jgi:hypothetical protein
MKEWEGTKSMKGGDLLRDSGVLKIRMSNCEFDLCSAAEEEKNSREGMNMKADNEEMCSFFIILFYDNTETSIGGDVY